MPHQSNPKILCLETATPVCSVAIAKGADLLSLKEETSGNSHSQNIIPFIQEALLQANILKEELDAIAVSIGPGSYTGLRIGASTAKGIGYALNIPIIAISTLESIFYGAVNPSFNALYFPMIDARRMEVFMNQYNSQGQPLREVASVIVDESTFLKDLDENNIVFCGNGASKCKPLYQNHPNAIFNDTLISASFLIQPALKRYAQQQFDDIAYFEPFYLKDYIAGKPSVKGLH